MYAFLKKYSHEVDYFLFSQREMLIKNVGYNRYMNIFKESFFVEEKDFNSGDLYVFLYLKRSVFGEFRYNCVGVLERRCLIVPAQNEFDSKFIED